MELLESLDTIVVSQKKELGEILTGFETKNRYTVLDGSGNELYLAQEENGSAIARMFLKNLRSFEIILRDSRGEVALRVNRPFRFYFHELNICDKDGRSLGVIKREFTILRREYSLFDNSGQKIITLFGPLLRPWTFKILENSTEVGKLTKKWSGLLKESFTDADNFGVTFPLSWDKNKKALLLGAVFLIDFVHFENTNS